MIEGSGSVPLTNGSGSVPLTNGSGSRRPKTIPGSGSANWFKQCVTYFFLFLKVGRVQNCSVFTSCDGHWMWACLCGGGCRPECWPVQERVRGVRGAGGEGRVPLRPAPPLNTKEQQQHTVSSRVPCYLPNFLVVELCWHEGQFYLVFLVWIFSLSLVIFFYNLLNRTAFFVKVANFKVELRFWDFRGLLLS